MTADRNVLRLLVSGYLNVCINLKRALSAVVLIMALIHTLKALSVAAER